MKNRLVYFYSTITIIALGIFSRKIAGIPLIVGDALYAMMMYSIVRTLFIFKSKLFNAIIALTICFAIESLQLYQAEWIISIRKTTLGHYVFGEGFLWSDVLAYVVGVTLAYLGDCYFIKQKSLK